MLEVAETESPIRLRSGDPVQAELAHPGPEVTRKRVVAINLRGARCNLLLGEAAGAIADHRGAFAEIEVEDARRVGDHGLAQAALGAVSRDLGGNLRCLARLARGARQKGAGRG